MLSDRLASDRPLALVRHAPAAVLAATDEQGRNAFRGLLMTGFSDLEERLNPFSWKAKWLLEDRLKEAGIPYSTSLVPLKAHIVKDDTLYTGQNPASAATPAKKLVKNHGRGGRSSIAPIMWWCTTTSRRATQCAARTAR